ncbi:MAG: glycosyltransferase [Leptospiraceae bacterium]|nr:glycosyltransferase [Leptospiraceae bacterium]
MGKNTKPIIVVSAINFFEGGPLSILKDCVFNLVKYYAPDYEIIALVHRKELLDIKGVTIIEYPKSRSSYFYRLYYEYIHFNNFSKRINPYLWISLHDITPNVRAQRQIVYCHNPSVFYKATFKDFRFSTAFLLFTIFYKFLYRINIKKNRFVVVQQNWINLEFRRLFNIKNVITAYPFVSKSSKRVLKSTQNEKFIFFFPTIARSFKNLEVICDAVKILNVTNSNRYKVYLTIDGSENSYAKYIFNKYNQYSEIEFIGRITREKVYEIYEKTDCLLFPSKLETWGLPLSEFKDFNKPIIAADLPYAHETIGEYDKVSFFNPLSAKDLSVVMQKLIIGDNLFLTRNVVLTQKPDASNWRELLEILVNN